MSKHRRPVHAKTPKGSARGRGKRGKAAPVWIWAAVGAALVAAALFLLLRPAADRPVEISAPQAYDQYQGGAFFLDVRGQTDWADGHVPGSVSIPLDELAGRLDEVPRDRDIVVVCALGLRSTEGAQILVEAGFSPVACLSGGLQAWAAAGYPLEPGPV